jgi:hypothetical protein
MKWQALSGVGFSLRGLGLACIKTLGGWFVFARTNPARFIGRGKNDVFCHSERSEEPLFDVTRGKTKRRSSSKPQAHPRLKHPQASTGNAIGMFHWLKHQNLNCVCGAGVPPAGFALRGQSANHRRDAGATNSPKSFLEIVAVEFHGANPTLAFCFCKDQTPLVSFRAGTNPRSL